MIKYTNSLNKLKLKNNKKINATRKNRKNKFISVIKFFHDFLNFKIVYLKF